MSKFSKLKFKIFDFTPDVDIVKQFPELSKYQEITECPLENKNLILRYIIFLFDPESDLQKDIPDLKSRRIHAAKLAGFDDADNLSDLFKMKDDWVKKLFICFISKIYHQRYASEWFLLQNELDQITQMRITDDVTIDNLKNRKLLRDQSDEINGRIDEIEPIIFGEDTNLIDLFQQSRFMSPESFAGAQLNQES